MSASFTSQFEKEEKDAFYSFRLKDEVGLDVCLDEQICEFLVSYL